MGHKIITSGPDRNMEVRENCRKKENTQKTTRAQKPFPGPDFVVGIKMFLEISFLN